MGEYQRRRGVEVHRQELTADSCGDHGRVKRIADSGQSNGRYFSPFVYSYPLSAIRYLMSITVKIASPLRSYTGGQNSVTSSGATVAEVLADLERRYAGMRFRMIDEQNQIRQHIRLFVNTSEVKTLDQPVREGDTVHLICALSGG